MKTIATKIILVFISITVFTTGMGTTIVSFCCDNCISDFFAEISVTSEQNDVEAHSCCSHKLKHSTEKATCHHHSNKEQSKEKDCCKIERYSQILDSYHSKPSISLPFIWISQQPIMVVQCINNVEDTSSSLLSYLKIPPNIIDTRTYLSIIRILII